MQTNRSDYEKKAKIIKAIAHPSRLMMVDALAKGEKCVCELTDLVGADVSTVSKHLAVMKQAGVVKDRREGKMIIYSLAVPCIVSFFDCVDAVIRESDETTTCACCKA